MLNIEVDIISEVNVIEFEKIEGNIEFKNVSYSYMKNNEYVLKDILFNI